MAQITNGIELLNAMRTVASDGYQEAIPEATQDNISLIGDLLDQVDYAPQRDEFTGLLKKIALTIYEDRAYRNPYGFADKGQMPVGETIEEVAQTLIASNDFDPEGTKVLVRSVPKSFNFYHSHVSKRTYKTTVSRDQIRQAFRSESTLNSFLTLTINQLYNSFERDEELIFKETLGNMYRDAYIIASPRPVDADTSKEFLALLREYTAILPHYHTEYNPVGHTEVCPTSKLVLIVDAKTIAKVSVEALASAFNKGDIDYTTRIVAVDNFGDWVDEYDDGDVESGSATCTKPYAMLIDEDAFMFYTQSVRSDSAHNAEGSFDNIYLHIDKNYAWSKIHTIIAFAEKPIAMIRVADSLKESGVFATSADGSVNVCNDENGKMVVNVYNYLSDTTYTSVGITWVYSDGTAGSATVTPSGSDPYVLTLTPSTSKEVVEILISSLA